MALSAPLLTRKRVIKIILEAVKGTKLAGTQALLCFEPRVQATSPFQERKGSGTMRGHEHAGNLGEHSASAQINVEMRGNGSHGMEAGLAILLQCAGFKKATEVYSVHSTHSDDKTISLDYWKGGKKKGLRGVSGNVTFEGDVGKPLMCNFELSGVWQAVVDEALPANAPSTTMPLLLQGGTFTIGGEARKISKFSLNMGNVVVPRLDVNATGGIAYYMVTDYDPVISIDLEEDLVAGYDDEGIWQAGTTAAVSLVLTDGTDTVTFAIPAVQYKELSENEREGIEIYDAMGVCIHSSGNDAVSIAVT